MAECSPLKLTSAKRPKISVSAEHCFICKKPGTLRKPGDQGKKTFIDALIRRKYCGNYELFNLLHIIDTEKKEFKEEVTDFVRWHKDCYSSYVSKTNILHVCSDVTAQELTSESPSSSRVTRSTNPTIDLKKVCLFCSKTNYKGNKKMSQVEYETFWKTLEQRVKEKKDDDLIRKIGNDFSKLPALEARYHKECYASYLKPDQVTGTPVNNYDIAFQSFKLYLDSKLNDNRAVTFDVLMEKFKECLIEAGISEIDSEKYQGKHLKERIKKSYGNEVIFSHSHRKNESQFIYSAKIDIKDTINTMADKKRSCIQLSERSEDVDDYINENEELRTLYHAAKYQFISLNKIEQIVPPRLYKFLEWVCGDTAKKKEKIYSIAQTLIYVSSSGNKKMPKQVGNAMAIKNALRSKEFITILNKQGDSISYFETLNIESYWANEIIENGEVYSTILTNMKQGFFTQAATDNSDYMQENASQHITNTVLYQYPLSGTFSDKSFPMKTGGKRRRSVNVPEEPLLHIVEGSKPDIPSYFKNVKLNDFIVQEPSKERLKSIDKNLVWGISRHISVNYFNLEIQEIPGWSGFHSVLSCKLSTPTILGNCRAVPSPPTDKNVVFTVLVSVKNMMNRIGQHPAIVTCDEAVYALAKEVQWMSDGLQDVVIRMGGFHRSKNFLGKIFN